MKINCSLGQAEQERYLAMVPYAKSADFSSFVRQHEPLCHQNTRVEILKELEEWSEDSDGKYVYWLNGIAGTGKSTIARTFAHQIKDKGHPYGTFFFSRGGGELSKADKLGNTLAVSLARKSPALLSHICEAIKTNNDIGYQGIREQWKQLIYEPLAKADKAMQGKSCFILVIDALDECDSQEDVSVFLELLSMVKDLKKAQLRILVTSRPELGIRLGFHNMSHIIYRNLVLHQVDRSIVNHDIRLFLVNEMARISSRRKTTIGWPGEDAIDMLVERADCLFIYAATVSRYVGESPRISPEKRLSNLLAGTSSRLTAERSLDVMYLKILEDSLAVEHSEQELMELSSQFKLIVGAMVLLYEPLSTESLSELLSIHLAQYVKSDEAIRNLVNIIIDPFASLLNIPLSCDSPIQILHPSFRDFLTSEDRCTTDHFWVDSQHLHGELCSACLHVLNSDLEPNYSHVQQPGLLSADFDPKRLRQTLQDHVCYASRYWVRHFTNSARGANMIGISRFFEKDLLKWLKLILYLGELGDIIADLSSLSRRLREDTSNVGSLFLQVDGSTARINTTLEEVFSGLVSFLRTHRAIIEHAPHQLYVSALLLSPQDSIVRKLYQSALLPWITRTPIVEKTWNGSLETFEAHNEEITDLTTCPGSRFVVSGSKDGTVKVWNLQEGSLEATLIGHSGPVQSVSLSTTSRIVASASKDFTARIWNVRTGACLHVLEGHTSIVQKVMMSSKLNIVATGSQDGDVRLWNASTGEMSAVLTGEAGAVTDMAFSTDGQYLAAGYYDGPICLWDPIKFSLLSKLCSHESAVNSVLISDGSRGRIIASGSYDRTVKVSSTISFCSKWYLEIADQGQIWSVPSGDLIATFLGHTRLVKSISCSFSGARVASGSFDNTVKVWDIGSGELINTLKGHKDALISVAFAGRSETILASAGKDRTVRVWDSNKSEALLTYKGHSRTVNAIAWAAPNAGQELLASASRDCTIRIWDPSSQKPIKTDLASHSDDVSGIEISPDGRLLATRSKDNSVKLWQASSGEILHSFHAHSDWVSKVIFSPNSQMLASGAHDHAICLYHIDGRILARMTGHSRSLVNLVFSPDNEKVASYAYDRSLKIWNIRGDLLCDFSNHMRQINTIQFSADSRRLTSGSYDCTVAVYDVEKKLLQQTLRGHIRSVNAVCFSPDGNTVASGSKDHTIKIWDVVNGQLKLTLRGHSGSVAFVLFSQRSDKIITRAGSLVHIWNAVTGDLLSVQTNIDSFLLDMGASGAWSPNEAILVKQVAAGQLEDQLSYRYSRKWLRISSEGIGQPPNIIFDSFHHLNKVDNAKTEDRNHFGVNKNLQWITHDSEDVLFLPGHLRPRVFAVAGETIITGNGTGKVMIFGFDHSMFGKPNSIRVDETVRSASNTFMTVKPPTREA